MPNRFLKRLASLIEQRRLTDNLHLLEQFGYDLETAISLLGRLQSKGVRA